MVLIENQLEQTDHTHLGQIITYPAGLNAVTAIWIAGKFVEQHRAALDWPNEITNEGTTLAGVEVELWRIGDSPQMAPKFNLVSKPHSWSKQVAKVGRSGRKWDESSFFTALTEREPDAVAGARAARLGPREHAGHPGEGAADGSFFAGFCRSAPIGTSPSARGPMEGSSSSSSVTKYCPVFDDPGKRLELMRKLNDEVGLGLSEERIDLRPSVPLVSLKEDGKLAALLRVLDRYVEQITTAAGDN